MRLMVCLVLVEGVSDEGVVQGLAERLGVRARTLRMRGNRPKKAIRIVNAELTSQNYSKVIVIKDQHSNSEDMVREKLRKIAAGIQHCRTYTVMVSKAVEAWILAGIGINNAESIENAKERIYPSPFLGVLCDLASWREGQHLINSDFSDLKIRVIRVS